MDLTWHWIQRVGACAVAAMAEVDRPGQVGSAHLDQVVDTIVSDAAAAARAPRKGAGYAWWLALAAGYPNSPATHPARGRWSDAELRTRVEALFVPDPVAAPWECWCCTAPTATRWGKSLWPLASAVSEVNTAQRRRGRVEGGVAVCRSCRISAWALPYSSVHNGATITTCDLDQEGPAMEVARLVVGHNRRVIVSGEASWPHPRTPHGLDELLCGREHTRHVWRNDNRAPSVTSVHVPARVVVRSPHRRETVVQEVGGR